MIAILVLALVVTAIIALTVGAAGIPLSRLPAGLKIWREGAVDALTTRDQLVLWSIRIPRIAAAAMVGGLLAAAGAIMQGLFRNPLADPALVGVSSGGALAAATAIVFTDSRFGEIRPLPADRAAAAGGLRRLAGHDHHPLQRLQPLRPHFHRDLPARRRRHHRHHQCRHRAARVHRRRPPAARHHVLDAGLDERRDLGQGPRRWRLSC